MKTTESIEKTAKILLGSKKTVALTGAGASTESGIPDFRSKGGLWSRYDPMEYGTISAFRRDPAKIWTMLRELLSLTNARPNDGHLALAALEKKELLQGIITQNIDGLHQKAGSENVIEFHGSTRSLICLSCGNRYAVGDIKRLGMPPKCDCSRILKPEVVFFDEQIPADAMRTTEQLLSGTEVLLVIGTSCQVMPAAMIPHQVIRHGGRIIEINREPVLHYAAITLAGGFSGIMNKLLRSVEQLI
jgi:NAD-dependent deacetylase